MTEHSHEHKELCPYCHGTGYRYCYGGSNNRVYDRWPCFWCQGRGFILHGSQEPPPPKRAA